MESLEENKSSNKEKLLVVWTSGDRDVALKMVFMYTRNAKKNDWWEKVRLVVWGPSQKLLANDEELQGHIKILKDYGVEVYACIACAEMYGLTSHLHRLGIEVKGMGMPLTEMLKEGWTTLTF